MASIVMVAIRAPHGQRSHGIPVVRSRKGKLEIVLLTIAWLAFFLPLIWIATPVLASADYTLRPVPLLTGTVCLTLGLWRFQLSHELVDYARGAGEAHACHAGRLPPGPSPDVHGSPAIFGGPSARSSQLRGGPVLRRHDGSPRRPPHRTRGADDARGIREGLPGVYGADEAPGPRHLVRGERAAA